MSLAKTGENVGDTEGGIHRYLKPQKRPTEGSETEHAKIHLRFA